MILKSRLFWHEFRHAFLPRGWLFSVGLSLVCAAVFWHAASPEVTKDVWSGALIVLIGIVGGLAIGTILMINPRNPATLNKTLPTPFTTLIAGRLSAVFLVGVFLPWATLTGAMAVKFPGGFLPTSAMIFVILWLCFWGFAFYMTMAGESKPELVRHAALTGAAAVGPTLVYGIVKYFVGRDWLEPNGNSDSTLNLLITLGIFSVILPLLCVSAWRMPFRKIRFRWYGPAVLMIAPFIGCMPSASLLPAWLTFEDSNNAPGVIASFPADEGGTIRADNFIATISPAYFDGDRAVEVELKAVGLNSPGGRAFRNFKVVLHSEESKRFVVLYSNSSSSRGSLLLNHCTSRFFLSGNDAQKAAALIRPRILLLRGDRFSDHLMSGSTDEHRIPEGFAFPPSQPTLPISEAILTPVIPASAE